MNVEPELLKLAEDSSWEPWAPKSDMIRFSRRRRQLRRARIGTTFVVALALCIPLALAGGVPSTLLRVFLQSGSSAAQEGQSLPQLSASSSLSVNGTATDQRIVHWHGADYTVTTVAVLAVIKGADNRATITVRQLGTVKDESGRSGSQSEDVAPLLATGKEYILYLNPEPAGNSPFMGEYFVSSPQAIWARVGDSSRYSNLLDDITVPKFLTISEATSAAAREQEAGQGSN